MMPKLDAGIFSKVAFHFKAVHVCVHVHMIHGTFGLCATRCCFPCMYVCMGFVYQRAQGAVSHRAR